MRKLDNESTGVSILTSKRATKTKGKTKTKTNDDGISALEDKIIALESEVSLLGARLAAVESWIRKVSKSAAIDKS
jgi:hypothetical protein